MRMFSFPSQLAIQTSVSFLSRAESATVTVYATHLPSGENCGSRTSRTRKMSLARSGRLAAAGRAALGVVPVRAGAWAIALVVTAMPATTDRIRMDARVTRLV